MSTTIIILKLNKVSYNFPKSFRPIILLNTLGKLIEKVISDRLQFHLISNNFIHQYQLGSLKFKTISDAGIALTHFIHMRWVRNLPTSILAFDILQFFPSINYHLLLHILKKAGFDFLYLILMLELDKVLSYPLFCPLSILLLFFIFLKNI